MKVCICKLLSLVLKAIRQLLMKNLNLTMSCYYDLNLTYPSYIIYYHVLLLVEYYGLKQCAAMLGLRDLGHI